MTKQILGDLMAKNTNSASAERWPAADKLAGHAHAL